MIGRIGLCLAAALFAAAPRAHAVPGFDKENPVVFSSAAPQAVTYSAPAASFTYPIRMYFIRTSSQVEVGSAVSADGVAGWTEESPLGRLSTTTLPSVSASSITGCGVLPLTGGGFRMLYSIVSTTGAYRIHSATSADGLAWANDTGTRIDGGATYLASPKLVQLSDASWRLYFVGSTVAGSSSAANGQIFTARSTDLGLHWTTPSLVISTLAYEVGASVLTNGKVRLYYTEPVGGASSATVVASALSTDANGSSFNVETGFRVSTSAASGTLSFPVPARSTDTFRWRLYYDFADPGTLTTSSVHTALTGAPAPVSVAPGSVLNVSSTQTFTISGEVFSSPAPALQLSYAGQTLLPSAVTRVNDQTLTAQFDVLNQTTGRWDLTVTNADGRATTLPAALFIDFPGGSVGLLNNVLRPRTGGTTAVAITTFNDGNVLARLYTSDGRAVRTLYDGPATKGTLHLTWDGRDATGGTVASGLYLLRVVAPKIDLKDKIVVIR